MNKRVFLIALSCFLAFHASIGYAADERVASIPDVCTNDGDAWKVQIFKNNLEKNVSPRMFIFNPDGSMCNAFPSYFGVAGEPIYVGIIGKGDEGYSVSFDPCSKESSTPSVLVTDSGAFSLLQGSEQKRGFGTSPYQVMKFPPRQCFNENLTITIKNSSGTAVASLPFQQYQRYRATLQIGALFSPVHDTTFGTRTVNNQSVVFSEGPTGKGPEYVATLVVYGLPHYLHQLVGGPAYHGREVVNEREWADVIGGVIGVGLNDPGKRFVTGLSFELLAGINLLGVWEFAETTQLVGINEGDALPPGVTTPSTRKHWDSKAVVGLSFDLRYITALFGRK